MPYRSGNYSFVIDSSFRPYSFEEVLKPLSIYAEAYKETENAYTDITDKANKFAYLAKITDNDDPAKKIYEKYASDLAAQAADLSKNGLTMGNRRALTELKRRYSGEMGMLEQADERLKAEQKTRDAMRAKGVQMYYANENPRLSDYLYEQTPNQYGISADDLYAKGAAAGKAFSSRFFTNEEGKNILNGFYQEYLQKRGIDPTTLNDFQRQMVLNGFKNEISTLPELQQIVVNGLTGLGVYDNLKGNNLKQAELNFLNGVVDGTVFDVDVKPYKREDKITPYQQAQLAQSQRQMDLSAALYGKRWDDQSKTWVDDSNLQNVKGRSTSTTGKTSSSNSTGRVAGANKVTQSPNGLRIKWRGDTPNNTNEDADNDYEIENIANDDTKHEGVIVNYDNLPAYAKKIADEIIGDADDADLYQYYFQPYQGGLFNDTEAVLEVIPRDIKEFHQPDTAGNSIFDLH